jgi:hypothetical protein
MRFSSKLEAQLVFVAFKVLDDNFSSLALGIWEVLVISSG